MQVYNTVTFYDAIDSCLWCPCVGVQFSTPKHLIWKMMPEEDDEEEVAGNEMEVTTALNRPITVIVDCINVTSSYSYI